MPRKRKSSAEILAEALKRAQKTPLALKIPQTDKTVFEKYQQELQAQNELVAHQLNKQAPAQENTTKPKNQQETAALENPESAAKTSELAAKTPELAAKTPELAAKTSELAAKTSELAAKTPKRPKTKGSELAAKTPELAAKTLSGTKKDAAQETKSSPSQTKTSELAAKTPELAAKTHTPANPEGPGPVEDPAIAKKEKTELAAKTPELAAKTPELAAKTSELAAKTPSELAAKTPSELAAKTPSELAAKTYCGGRPSKGTPSPGEASILSFIAATHGSVGGHSVKISRKDLAAGTGQTPSTARSSADRLVAKGYIKRVAVSRSRTSPGTAYSITAKGRDFLRGHLSWQQKPHPSWQQKPHLSWQQNQRSSSSSNNISTTSTTTHSELLRKEESELLADAALRFGLEDRNIGAPHLQQSRNATRDRLSLEDFLLSVEHIAFYLRTASGISHPAAWVVRELRKGFFPQPPGFVSWEDEQQELIRQAARDRRQREAKQQAENLKHLYPEWRRNLAEDRVAEITGGPTVPSDVSERLLEDEFLREHLRQFRTDHQLPLLPDPDS